MAVRDSTQATPPCHIRWIKIGRMVYDYRRKNRHPAPATLPWLAFKHRWFEHAGCRAIIPQ